LPFVFVQSFDATTALSNGPATVLFASPDSNTSVHLEAAAVAPTGEIALSYSEYSGGHFYVAFLGPAADGGVAGLTVLNNVLVTANYEIVEGSPSHVIWSNATQSFVVSYVAGGPVESIAMLTATGGETPGGVAAVTTTTARPPETRARPERAAWAYRGTCSPSSG
jgi:hypothetical protein